MIKATSKSAARAACLLGCSVFTGIPCYGQSADSGAPLLKLEVRGLGNPEGARVMFLNAFGPDCRRSLVLPLDANMYDTRSGMLTLGEWASKTCWCEEPHARMAGLAVLSRDRAVAFIPNQRKRSNRPFSLCRRDAEAYVVKLRPRREVPVNVWAPDRRTRHMAQDDLVNADWVLNKELAGITLSPTFHNEKDELLKLGCTDEETEDECCERAMDSRFYQPGAINVFYGVGNRNFACPADVSDVIFIRSVPILGDAAHELGHRLGLSQSDNDSAEKRYAEGHTTKIPPFDERNVMWEGTQQLKNELSPAQAFWMSQSCTSYLVAGSSCLSCSPEPGQPSPCPRFSEGIASIDPAPEVCPAPPANELIMADGSPRRGDLPSTIFCSRPELKTALGERYSVLKRHRKGRRDLELGSVTKGDFQDRWMAQFQVRRVEEKKRR